MGDVRLTIDGVAHRYRVGEPGDIVLVGDFSCDGASSIALYRPHTGRVLEFASAGGPPIATAQLASGGVPVVERTPHGCEVIALT
jgi:hypothetical protein